jgi:hypothetical protein
MGGVDGGYRDRDRPDNLGAEIGDQKLGAIGDIKEYPVVVPDPLFIEE